MIRLIASFRRAIERLTTAGQRRTVCRAETGVAPLPPSVLNVTLKKSAGTNNGAAGARRVLIIAEADTQLPQRLAAPVYEISTAAYADALRLIGEFKPDIVLLDVSGDTRDLVGLARGVAVARRLRAQESKAALPLVFVVSQEDRTTRSVALDIRADDYFSRAISDAEMRARLDALFWRIEAAQTVTSFGELADAVADPIDPARESESQPGPPVSIIAPQALPDRARIIVRDGSGAVMDQSGAPAASAWELAAARERELRASGAVMPTRLLLAIANPARLAQINSLIRAAGYEARAAFDGHRALDLMRLEPPDLVLLDSDLPDMSGIEVLRLLRHRGDQCAVPVILLLAAFSEGARREALDLGARHVVALPCDPAELLASIRVAGSIA